MKAIASVELTGTRDSVFNSISTYLKQQGFIIASKDFNRPWGGFFVLDESQAQQFAEKYFHEVDFNTLMVSGKLSPKILVVNAQKRLSGNTIIGVLKCGSWLPELLVWLRVILTKKDLYMS